MQFCLLVACILPSADVDAGVIIAHRGANNPLTEGFSNGQPGNAVFNDLGTGLDAWNIQGIGSFPRYHFTPSASQIAELVNGYRATARLRNLVTSQNPADTSNYFEMSVAGVGSIELKIGADSLGNPLLNVATSHGTAGTSVALDSSITGSGYHEYQLIYNPNVSASQVTIVVDGIDHGLTNLGTFAHGNRLYFGSSNRSPPVKSWNANWNLFEVESGLFTATAPSVVPEPTSLAIFGIVTLGATCLRRRRMTSRRT